MGGEVRANNRTPTEKQATPLQGNLLRAFFGIGIFYVPMTMQIIATVKRETCL
jgi:hypothetical protein